MSDRVGYVVGNTSGRDHVNWRTILRSEIETLFPGITTDEKDQIWPVDITLAQIMALNWRVRKWSLTGTITVAHAIGVNFTANASIELDAAEIVTLFEHPIDGIIAATRERDLLSRVDAHGRLLYEGLTHLASLNFEWALSGLESGVGYSVNSNATVNSQSLVFLRGPVLFKADAPNFAPANDGIGRVLDDDRLIVDVRTHRNPQTILTGTTPISLRSPGTLTVKPGIADDYDIPLEIIFRRRNENIGDTASGSASADLELTATEYWPYANSENLPVYDSSTGAQLRDPFS